MLCTLLVVLSLLLLHALSNAHFQVFGVAVSRVSTEEKVVALTFDDGPTPRGSSSVLGILRRHDVRATFFLMGSLIEKYPDAGRAIVDEGHELGNHARCGL